MTLTILVVDDEQGTRLSISDYLEMSGYSVIFLTIRNKTSERIQGYQSGVDLYLPKPFELTELGAAIRNRLERVHMLQSEYRLSDAESGSTPLQPLAVDALNPSI